MKTRLKTKDTKQGADKTKTQTHKRKGGEGWGAAW